MHDLTFYCYFVCSSLSFYISFIYILNLKAALKSHMTLNHSLSLALKTPPKKCQCVAEFYVEQEHL